MSRVLCDVSPCLVGDVAPRLVGDVALAYVAHVRILIVEKSHHRNRILSFQARPLNKRSASGKSFL